MKPHASEYRNLERQITVARPIFLMLAMVQLAERHNYADAPTAFLLLGGYLALAILVAVYEQFERGPEVRIPVWLDIAVLGVYAVLSPSVVGLGYAFLFVAFAAGIRWEFRNGVLLAAILTAALFLKLLQTMSRQLPDMLTSLALTGGTFAAGAGAAYLGSIQRRNAAEHVFLAQLAGTIRVEDGVSESVRKLLTRLCAAFSCQAGVLVIRDDELDRLFLYRARHDEAARITPENLPFERADAYLLDQPDVSVGWNAYSDSGGSGFAWNRHNGRPVAPPRIPAVHAPELNAHSVLAVTIEHRGIATGRALLLNGGRPFTKQNLGWLERIARSIGPSLENLYSLRHLRAKAIESERTRFAHDLHDGILQTLLSFNIQLDVLRRKVLQAPDRVAADLAALQQTLRHESEELRRIVTDLRPLRVESADLVDLMRGFADRFRSESSVPLDLIADSINLQIPDRICRELFQIYREALNNIKKHASASHVVVKLWQDEEKATLVVDDNGQGFSFAGRFSSDELDRLRLGPISIKERTRSIGGNLTVESNPGHGARITVEVPLS